MIFSTKKNHTYERILKEYFPGRRIEKFKAKIIVWTISFVTVYIKLIN